jgi:hypothetical protein
MIVDLWSHKAAAKLQLLFKKMPFEGHVLSLLRNPLKLKTFASTKRKLILNLDNGKREAIPFRGMERV